MLHVGEIEQCLIVNRDRGRRDEREVAGEKATCLFVQAFSNRSSRFGKSGDANSSDFEAKD